MTAVCNTTSYYLRVLMYYFIVCFCIFLDIRKQIFQKIKFIFCRMSNLKLLRADLGHGITYSSLTVGSM